MKEEMAFAEGVYRTAGLDWEVFVACRSNIPEVRVKFQEWESGVIGLVIEFPQSGESINQCSVEHYLGEVLGVTKWVEVCGPDSMQLR